ncbi:hypothetical protein LTR36_001281 [Oleoguttula mirabilis]|uniref:Beta-lactamase-related domain-containing protein n=1 Tax=Oleoguttula mirabilis TaxID=1507867 RepID=A0AAV9JNT4_9PEZI|nr:hypothetical protein LTR36_001281 [Oleoguttula mirabilis]
MTKFPGLFGAIASESYGEASCANPFYGNAAFLDAVATWTKPTFNVWSMILEQAILDKMGMMEQYPHFRYDGELEKIYTRID